MTTRTEVVAEARTWLGTRYHHQARLKGVGVDCGQLAIAVYSETGAVPDFDPGFYTTDWHLHKDEDVYLKLVEEHLIRADGEEDSITNRMKKCHPIPNPGDLLLFKVGRTFSHGGIVTRWPFMIHSSLPAEIVEEIDIRYSYVCMKKCRVYTVKGFEE